MHRPRRNLLIPLIFFVIAAVSNLAFEAKAIAAICDKASLQQAAPSGTTITDATNETLPAPYQSIAYCGVSGSIATTSNGESNQVLFALGLPVSSWNQNFLFIGNEGFGGSLQAVDSGEFASAISRGYATAATDTGHESQVKGTNAFDASFALSNGQPNQAARDDFGWRAVHLTAVAAEALTEAYYESPMFSFFDGCSTGGRQGLVEAQEFPTDFNGIVAGAPAIGDPTAGFNWNEASLLSNPKSYLTESKLKLLETTVVQACDTADGEQDKLIQDPRKCNFDPSTLKRCPYDNDAADCFTTEQIAVVKDIYAGAKVNGVQLYPGYMPSDPDGPDGWAQWITGTTAPKVKLAEPWQVPPQSFTTAPAQWSFQDQFLKYFVFDAAGYDSLTFKGGDAGQLAQLTAAASQSGADGTNPNLGPFFEAGGKLIIYHGWSDPAMSPLESVQYYNSVAKQLQISITSLKSYARLFMVPGMQHCGGGPGPNVFDPLTPLVSWVEEGAAPNSLLAVHYPKNDPSKKVDRTMPLCAYPSTALFTGGNLKDGDAWVCSQTPPSGSTSNTSYLHEASLKLD
ncbi:MAG TPA: tannase/feruloyl esterase family alpha/beta hydrolase [Candidatus Binataceae bacterium]|nr:tannase/feruloyl esterase family alpha/beta hydrolase [Candidatus Binataceae bacterium]